MSSDPEATKGIERKPVPSLVWWAMVLRAVVVFALGVGFLASGKVNTALGNLLAMYWLVGAFLTVRWARANRGSRGSRLAAVGGIVGLLAAVVVLARGPLAGMVSVDRVLAIVGITAVITGAFRVSGAFHDDPSVGRRALIRRVLLGSVEIVVGVVFIVVDEIYRPVATTVGLWALVGGTIMLLDAIAMRRSAGSGDPHG